MPSKVERLEAELRLAKQEEKFVQAKTAGKVTMKMKLDLRAARQDFRENFRDNVTVSPGTVGSSATVANTGAGS